VDIVAVPDLEAFVHHLFAQVITESTSLDAIFSLDRTKRRCPFVVEERGASLQSYLRGSAYVVSFG